MLQKSLTALICLLLHFGANAQPKNETFTGGYSHSLIVCRNSNISSFGDNTLQQLGRDEMLVFDEAPGTIDYSDLPPIQSVHSSLSHSLALACDGTVWAWGDGTTGQLGNSSLTGKDNLPCHAGTSTPPNCLATKPIQVVGGETGTPHLENIVKVVAGYENSYAITEDGKLLAWGANDKGLLGNGTTGNPSASPAFVLDSLNNPLTDVLDVCATMYCTYVILDPDGDYAGNVYVFGDHTESNSFSMIGPNKTASYYPTPIRTQDGEIIRGITNLAGGDTHALFLDWHNQLWAIGGDWGPGQLGISEQPFAGYEQGYPYRVLAGEQKNMEGYENETYLSDVKDISAGYAHSLAIVECNGVRYMMAWGNNEFGQLGTGDKMGGILPHFVMQNTTSKLLNVQSISSGRNHSIAKTVDFETFEESLYIWGNSEYGQVGNTLSKAVTFPLEFQEIECSTANLCPIADFGSDTLWVCPSEMDTSLNQSILLDAGGSESVNNEYRWEATLNDGSILNNEFLKSFWIPSSNGKAIRCYVEGKYKVSVEEITNLRACNNCPIATDSIVIKYKPASFTQSATSFTGKTMPVKLSATNGTDYAFYAQETDQSPLATATKNNGTVQAQLNTDELERVNSINGTTLPEDSVYFQVWVEDHASSCNRLPILMKQLYEDSTTITTNTCGSYDFNGTILTKSGTYRKIVNNTPGNNSLVTLNLTIDTIFNQITTVAITEGDSYSWMGKEINQSGFYRDTTTDENGCATIYSLQLDVLKKEVIVELAETACGSYEFAGRTLTQSDTYYDTVALHELKDSITILALTINPAYDILISGEIEEGQTYAFNGQELSDAGEYTAELQTVMGCDSVVKLELRVIPDGTVFNSIEESICGKYLFGDLELTKTGIYKDTLTAESGADSIVTLKLTIDTVIAEVEVIEISFGNSYSWMGKEINQSGFYRDTTTDENGCATIYSLQLDVLKKEVIVELTETACGSYEFAGRTLTQSDTYYDTVALHELKDSITVLTLTVNPTYKIILSEEIEEGQTYTFNGQELSDAGEYTAELQTVMGCDSVVKLELRVIPEGTVFTSIEESICGKYLFGDLELTKTGIYKDTLTAESGADSIVTLKLTIDTVIAEVEVIEISFGNSYSWMGKEINQSGFYRDTTTDENGCATIYSLQLDVLKKEVIVEITETACGSYEFAGRTLTQSDTYYDTVALNESKDSITVLTLTVNPTYEILLSEEIEEGQTYTFNGQELSETGEYTAELKTVNGCDSIVKLELTVIPDGTVFTSIEESICGKYLFGDLELTKTGIYKDTLTAESGADSIVTLKLTIDTVIAEVEVEVIEISFGNSYSWMGKEINQRGFYRDTTTDENGCATIYSLQLDVIKKEVIVEITETACGSYEFAGRTLTQSDTYYDTVALNELKDSITVLTLTVNPTYEILLSEEIEEGQAYTFNGQELSDAGEYTAELKTVNGCDSIVKLELTVIPDGTVFTSIEESICGKYLFGDLELSKTGIYKDTLTAESGADSIVTLKLTIDTVVAEVETIEIAKGETYSWHGQNISDSGFYRDTTTDENGCATIYALELSISKTTEINTQQKNKIEIYPTAVSDKLIVIAPSGSEIALVSALGETILKANCNGKQELNLSSFANGTYFVKVKLANGEIVEKMIIKK